MVSKNYNISLHLLRAQWNELTMSQFLLQYMGNAIPYSTVPENTVVCKWMLERVGVNIVVYHVDTAKTHPTPSLKVNF